MSICKPSRMRLGDEIDRPVTFQLHKKKGGPVIASGTLKFIANDGGCVEAIDVSFDDRYDINETLRDLLLSMKHWRQSNDIKTIMVTVPTNLAPVYRSCGFSVPETITMTAQAA